MDFTQSLSSIVTSFDRAGIRYALIGGLAMAIHGVQRATLDADFILLSDDIGPCDGILRNLGYHRAFHTENVSHYVSPDLALGRIDFLHAFRPATLGMLRRSERLALAGDLTIPVVQIEDLIGLKIQASVNDPDRHDADWHDILRLVDHSASSSRSLDWELIGDYLSLFDLSDRLCELQQRYGPPSRE